MARRFSKSILFLAAGAALCAAPPAAATMPPPAGPLPAEVSTALREGVLSLPAPPAELGVSATQAVWRVPVILVGYSDEPLVYPAQDFDIALFDSTGTTPTGSVYDYYRWASGNRLTVHGRVVATVQLPHERAYYGYNSWGLNRISTPNNSAGLVRDALLACNTQVQWSDFDVDRDGYVDMAWVVHAGIGGEASTSRNDLWSITSRLSSYWNNSSAFETWELVPGSQTLHERVDRFSILPERSSFQPGQRSEIGVYCHEFGHALGLPDLYDTRDGGVLDSGPGNWSLMSTGGYGGDGMSPQYPTFVGAWPALFLGWAQSVRPAFDSTLTLPPVTHGGPVVEFWFQGEANPEHFLLETRRRESFDLTLPGEGLIVYHVDDAVIGQGLQANTVNAGLTPGLVIVEADGHDDLTQGGNRGDGADPYPGLAARNYLYDSPAEPNTRTFSGAFTSIGLFGIEPVPEGARLDLKVRAAGWQPAEDRTEAGYAPSLSFGSGATAGIAEDGTIYVVAGEARAGHDQVVLRARRDGSWEPGFQVSHSAGDAGDPTLAMLPGGDLAMVWSDTRSGRATLWYRSRIRGVWTDEQQLADPPGESFSPAAAADSRGGIHVAWMLADATGSRVMFLRFPYLSPYGQPAPLTGAGAQPGGVTVAAGRDGGSYILWSEGSSNPASLRFVRYHPDSGLGPGLPLTRTGGQSQSWASALVDSAGTLHTVWIESGAGVSELRYQRRLYSAPPSPSDTLLEGGGGALQSARLARDPLGGLHVVYQNSVAGVPQARYKRRHPERGWDTGATEVTLLSEGPAERPAVLAAAPDEVSVLYSATGGATPRFMQRRRTGDLPPALAAPRAPAVAPTWLSLVPNPLRAGQGLELRWAGPATRRPAALEVFDLTGRRVAVAPLEGGGGAWHARFAPGATAAWPSGVYFARPTGGRSAARLVVLR
ncbi:MAG: M6 family metalloprotease domain-containing protein [Candidatus Eisenbacteria bacterium]|nr:M6 family metalloprotease domain-containing protein [Candidatus Eisenbacteria bacterium]